MTINSLNNFIETFSSIQWKNQEKCYIYKNEDGTYQLDPKKKNLHVNEILDVVNQCLILLEESEFKSFSSSLHSFSKKVFESQPWWKQILIRLGFSPLHQIKKIENKWVKISNNPVIMNFYNFKGQDIRKIIDDSQTANLLNEPDNLKKVINELPKEEVKNLIFKIRKNYLNFIDWIDSINEKNQNKDWKDILLRKKSYFIDEIYGKYANLIHSFSSSFPEIFANQILPIDKESSKKLKEKYPITVVMPEGTRVVIKRIKESGSLSGKGSVYDSFAEYEKKLPKKINSDGKYYFIIRCKEPSDNDPHQIATYIERKGDKITEFSLEEVLNKKRLAMVEKIEKITYQYFPNATVCATMSSRQCDNFNCSTIAIEDILTLSRYKGNETSKLCQNSIPIRESKQIIPTDPESKLILSQELPLPFLATMQSCSHLKSILKNYKKNPPEGYKELKRLQKSYTIFDLSLKKEVYVYTKIMGNKYRLEIIENAFSYS